MLYSTLILAASAFAGVSAQLLSNETYNTPIQCCSVPANSVPPTEREDWCEAQKNTCVDLCGGEGQIGSTGNDCDDTTLEFTCSCRNGTNFGTQQVAPYQQTVPALMCRFWFNTCVNSTGTDRAQQFQCQLARNEQCGNLTIEDDGTTSSAAPSGTSTPSPSGSGSPDATTSGTEPAQSTAAGAGASLAQYGTPILAGGLLAVFGIAI